MATSNLEPAGPATRLYRRIFLAAGLWDGILGAVFFLFYPWIFDRLGIPLPNNTSYIHLTATFVFVQGVGYWLVYRDMAGNLGIVKIGIVYKVMYSGVALYYLAIGQLVHAVFAWFAVVDILFIVAFVRYLMLVRSGARRPTAIPRPGRTRQPV